MWKRWKKEIIGISLASVLGVCLIAGLIFYFQKAARENQHYNTHVMIDGTLYWLDHTLPELPEGYEEFTQVESNVPNRKASQNGQAHGLAAGTPLYRSEAQPGCLYTPADDGRWDRLMVMELKKAFLRYQGMLYISLSSIHEVELDLSYEPEDFIPTGEIISWPGWYEVIPAKDCITNSSKYSGGEVCLDPRQSALLVVKYAPIQNGTATADHDVFVSAGSIGLDYSAYDPHSENNAS